MAATQIILVIVSFGGAACMLIAVQIQNFNRTYSGLVTSSTSECFVEAGATQLTSACLLHSLERGIIFYDARKETLRFRFHEEGVLIDLRTPTSVAERWGDHPWVSTAAAVNAKFASAVLSEASFEQIRRERKANVECRETITSGPDLQARRRACREEKLGNSQE